MVWLSGMLPYEQASEVFSRIGRRLIPAVSLWRQTREYGRVLQEHLVRQQEMVSLERVKLPGAFQDHHQRKGIGMDGGMVNIRGEGWKEIKVGAVFDVEIRLEYDRQSQELLEQPHGVNVEYSAVLGSPDALSPALWRLAVQRQIPLAAETSVTADGAEWIWNLAADLFPDSVQIVDWYHACDHLADAAAALYPDDPNAAQRWLKQRKDDLFLGHVRPVTDPLDNAGLSDHSHYFHTHQHRMLYHEFHENGFPIGSGTTESGIKQFKSRLTGSGMRWSRQAAQHMLIIRAAVLGGSFDALWNSACFATN